MPEQLDQLIKSSQLKLTGPRLAILEILTSNYEAKTAYELLAQYRQKCPSGKAMTIYRALEYFVTQKIVHKIPSQNKYKICMEEHQHHLNSILICTRCQHSVEIKVTSAAIFKIAQMHHFKVTQPIVEIIGICQNCQV